MQDIGVRVPLTNCGGFALVDECDADRVLARKWQVLSRRHTSYVQATSGDRALLHRFVIIAPAGMQVDPTECDGLNNRRSNLRICPRSPTNANRRAGVGTSRFKGVSWNRKNARWQVFIKATDKNTFLGQFKDEEDAARCYDAAAIRLFGEFARLNFPSEVMA